VNVIIKRQLNVRIVIYNAVLVCRCSLPYALRRRASFQDAGISVDRAPVTDAGWQADAALLLLLLLPPAPPLNITLANACR